MAGYHYNGINTSKEWAGLVWFNVRARAGLVRRLL
jgi:hypothetical protein